MCHQPAVPIDLGEETIMGLRDDAIAASQSEESKRLDEQRRIKAERAAELSRRESESRNRAMESVHRWLRDMNCDPQKVQVKDIDYYFSQDENGLVWVPNDRPSNECWHNAVLLTWRVDGDKFVGEFSFHVEKNKAGSYSYNERERFEVWILIDGDAFFALTKEELGAAYTGRGIKRRNSWEMSDRRWSPLFANSQEVHLEK
jgi:hypothetical protein